jgi:hypothetical protein
MAVIVVAIAGFAWVAVPTPTDANSALTLAGLQNAPKTVQLKKRNATKLKEWQCILSNLGKPQTDKAVDLLISACRELN